MSGLIHGICSYVIIAFQPKNTQTTPVLPQQYTTCYWAHINLSNRPHTTTCVHTLPSLQHTELELIVVYFFFVVPGSALYRTKENFGEHFVDKGHRWKTILDESPHDIHSYFSRNFKCGGWGTGGAHLQRTAKTLSLYFLSRPLCYNYSLFIPHSFEILMRPMNTQWSHANEHKATGHLYKREIFNGNATEANFSHRGLPKQRDVKAPQYLRQFWYRNHY